MEKHFNNLTRYEKKFKWTRRFDSIYRLFLNKLIYTLFREKKSWVFNILIILPVIIAPIRVLSGEYIIAAQFFSLYSNIMFFGYFGIIIPLFTMYIATMLFNDDINDKTITYLTSRPIHRFELIFIKYLSYLTIIPPIIVFATFLNYLSFGVFGRFQFFDMAWWFMIISIIAAIVYGAFFMFIGLLFKNPLWFGLFFVFIWEFVLASFSPTLNNLTIAFYIKSLIVYPIYKNPSPIYRTSPAIFPGNYADIFQNQNIIASPLNFSSIFIIIVVISLVLSWALLQGDRFTIPYQAGRKPGGWKYYLKEIRSYLISFGIILITMGLVLGPINGVYKNVSNSKMGTMEMNNYKYQWYNPETNNKPTLSDMGWGISYPYILNKGDSVTITFTILQGQEDSALTMGVICSKEHYLDFFTRTQNLWRDWANDHQNNLTLYYNLLQEYDYLALSFVSNADHYILYTNYSPNSIELNSSSKIEYYFVALYLYTSLSSQFLYVTSEITVVGITHRWVSYGLGFISLGLGSVIFGLSIYSIVTYSSEVEIQRYEERIKKTKIQESIELCDKK